MCRGIKENAIQNLNLELTTLREKQGHTEETMLKKQRHMDKVVAEQQTYKQRSAELTEKVSHNIVYTTFTHDHRILVGWEY